MTVENGQSSIVQWANHPLLAIGRDWWLPANYSRHGVQIDTLFYWIFAITLLVFIGVQGTLIVFLVKYRAKPGRKKATFTHGNTRLEMIWTLAPALILAALAMAGKRVWDNFRSSPDTNDPGRTKVLVIGQQYKWNIIYPGPDGKFGRYLQFPKPTDVGWPVGSDGKPTVFAGVPGPSALPYAQAVIAINDYISAANPLGKDFIDPDGKDDDYQDALARTLYLPVNRPVEIQVASKDVIHDFYLPNFRAQLYAVPGTRNQFVFTPTITTAELESASRTTYEIDEFPALLMQSQYKELTVDVDENSPGAMKDKFGWKYVADPGVPKPVTILRNGMMLSPALVEKLKTAGVKRITAHLPAAMDIVCAQICGIGHDTMQGRIVVLTQAEFDEKFPASPHVAASGR